MLKIEVLFFNAVLNLFSYKMGACPSKIIASYVNELVRFSYQINYPISKQSQDLDSSYTRGLDL